MGALPIGENLEKRSLVSNTTCVHCGNNETTTHLFIHCQFAKRVWDLTPLLHTDLITEATYFGKAMKATKMTINLPPSGLSCDPLGGTLSKAVGLAREWQEAQSLSQCLVTTTTTTVPSMIRIASTLSRSSLNSGIAVHTDAAWKSDSNKAGLGWIFSDPTGVIISTDSRAEDYISSALVAEGLAIREALFQSRQRGYTNLTNKSDAQTLVKAINDRISLKELFGIIHDILNLSLEFSVFSFVYIHRKNNSAADALAKGALLASSSSA
ncbi:hypothetical protein Bca52824_027274 [Brassica carinata]|uniref:RNase H type-1 domain-containing protein n=1 Tax=Brassica carinata TaxID=52824 RepID=A0A8X7SJ56_BRACI|nr:hypothetical protein Bca52824_027274 [Brassica carinata]